MWPSKHIKHYFFLLSSNLYDFKAHIPFWSYAVYSESISIAWVVLYLFWIISGRSLFHMLMRRHSTSAEISPVRTEGRGLNPLVWCPSASWHQWWIFTLVNCRTAKWTAVLHPAFAQWIGHGLFWHLGLVCIYNLSRARGILSLSLYFHSSQLVIICKCSKHCLYSSILSRKMKVCSKGPELGLTFAKPHSMYPSSVKTNYW